MSNNDERESGGTITRRKLIRMAAIAGAILAAPWGWLGARSWAASAPKCTEDDLKAAFKAACDAFEKRDPTIGNLLAENVTVYSVKHQKPHTPKAAVIEYFKEEFKLDSPQFDPLAYGDLTKYKVNGSGTKGTVAGVARWTDKNGTAERLGFTFSFACDASAGKWLITVLWSKPE